MRFRSEVLRLDRMVTFGLAAPLQESFGYRRRGIPVLMYHSISDDLEPVGHPYFQTTTTPKTFRKHMAFLYRNGYSVLHLKTAVNLLQNGPILERKYVVLTFDDGFKDFYTTAFPILRQYDFPSTVFLPTAYIDDMHSKFKGRSCLSWDEVRELHKQEVDFGSHSVSHPELKGMSEIAIKAELGNSKRRIDSQLSLRTECFSYPYAFPEGNPRFLLNLKELLRSAGYRYGVTTRIGIAAAGEDPLFLRRIPLNDYDDDGFFEAKLRGAYNWVSTGQRLLKAIKNMVRIHQ